MTKKFIRRALVRPLTKFVAEMISGIPKPTEVERVQDILRSRAAERSAVFIESNMKSTRLFEKREEIWHVALERLLPRDSDERLVMEFGVWKGESLTFFANNLPGTVYGFDTFTGLQEDWPGTPLGEGFFALDSLPPVPENAHLVVGSAQDTAPDFLKLNPGVVALAHFDMDTYESTLDVLRIIRPRLSSGSILLFDEFLGYPLWEEGEFKAFQEFVQEAGLTYEYFATNGFQVGIQIT
jgi:hypothetical protein